jgi:hypothetical protein
MILRGGSFAGLGKKIGKICKGVLGMEPMCKGERSRE